MTEKRPLDYIRDLLTPGIAGLRLKYGVDIDIVVEGDKLVTIQRRILLDDQGCITREQQIAEVTSSFNAHHEEFAIRETKPANESQEELIKEADNFDWQCENGRWLAVRLVEEIASLNARIEALKQELKHV